MTNQPTLTVDLAAESVVEWANIAPRLTSPAGWLHTSALRQLNADTMRRFTVQVAPYPADRAREELEAEAEKYATRAAAIPAVGEKIRSLVEQGDATDDVFELARLIGQIRDVGNNPFYRP